MTCGDEKCHVLLCGASMSSTVVTRLHMYGAVWGRLPTEVAELRCGVVRHVATCDYLYMLIYHYTSLVKPLFKDLQNKKLQ